ncbi:hypothetical protein Trydic_g15149 [Trypoxylus dichotomus]
MVAVGGGKSLAPLSATEWAGRIVVRRLFTWGGALWCGVFLRGAAFYGVVLRFAVRHFVVRRLAVPPPEEFAPAIVVAGVQCPPRGLSPSGRCKSID